MIKRNFIVIFILLTILNVVNIGNEAQAANFYNITACDGASSYLDSNVNWGVARNTYNGTIDAIDGPGDGQAFAFTNNCQRQDGFFYTGLTLYSRHCAPIDCSLVLSQGQFALANYTTPPSTSIEYGVIDTRYSNTGAFNTYSFFYNYNGVDVAYRGSTGCGSPFGLPSTCSDAQGDSVVSGGYPTNNFQMLSYCNWSFGCSLQSNLGGTPDFGNRAAIIRGGFHQFLTNDSNIPSAYANGGSLYSSDWMNGIKNIYGNYADFFGNGMLDSGIIGQALYINGQPSSNGTSNIASPASICTKYRGMASNGHYTFGYQDRANGPCNWNVQGGYENVNVNIYSNGANTVNLYGIDAANNYSIGTNAYGSIAHTFYVDTLGPSVITNTPVSSGNWVRGTINITGSMNDQNSGWNPNTGTNGSGVTGGSSSYQMYYRINGGGWQQFCNNAGTTSLSCNLNTDTDAFPEGTRLEFITNGYDRLGNFGQSNISASVYVDNTPPSLTNLNFNNLSAANRWTNDDITTASWNSSSLAGSPLNALSYNYQSGPANDCTGSTSNSLTATDTSLDLNNSNVECQQGAHRLSLTLTDLAGNSTTINNTYNYDSIAPERPGNLTVDPATWTEINNFTIRWDNGEYNGTTSSPFVRHKYRVNNESPAKISENCLGSGTIGCQLRNIQVPEARGAYNFKIWTVDEAGNENEDNAASGTLYYDKQGLAPGEICPVT